MGKGCHGPSESLPVLKTGVSGTTHGQGLTAFARATHQAIVTLGRGPGKMIYSFFWDCDTASPIRDPVVVVVGWISASASTNSPSSRVDKKS